MIHHLFILLQSVHTRVTAAARDALVGAADQIQVVEYLEQVVGDAHQLGRVLLQHHAEVLLLDVPAAAAPAPPPRSSRVSRE